MKDLIADMNPERFPFEAFIQQKVEQYFLNDGFVISSEIPYLDLYVKSIENEDEWKIECKGETKAISVDFNTGLGQILKKMEDEDSKYALALPDISSFRKQTEQIPSKVRTKLNLYWIWVKENGEIEIDIP